MNYITNFFNNDKKFWISSIVAIFLFILPVLIFGMRDQESYGLGLFTQKIYFNNFNALLNGYIDFYGAGSLLPIGQPIIFHPANIFINYPTLYFLTIFGFNVFIQVYFFNKILRRFFIKDSFINSAIVIFSISNFNYIYSDDWSSVHYGFSLLFPIFYYFDKFLETKNIISIFKFSFLISIQFLSSHNGSVACQYIFLFIYFLLKFEFKFLLRPLVIISFISIIFIINERLFFYYNSYLNFPEYLNRDIQPGYKLLDYFNSIFLPFKDIEPGFNRSPHYGLSLVILTLLIILNFEKIKKIKKILFCFISLFFLSLWPNEKDIGFISGVWFFRDSLNFLMIFIISYCLNNYKKKFSLIIKIILILNLSMLFYQNFKMHLDFERSNFISQKDSHLNDFKKFLTSSNNQYGKKTYLSKRVFEKSRNGFRKYDIYSNTDFINFSIFPFNGWFKNISMDEIYKSKNIMHGFIGSNIDHINNKFFRANFSISKALLFKDELNQIKTNYKIISNLNLSKISEEIFSISFQNEGFPIIKPFFVNALKKNNLNFNENFKIDEIFNEKNFDLNKNVSINKINDNQFLLINLESNNHFIIFPFYDFKNWNCNSGGKIKISKQFAMLELPHNQRIECKYIKKYRYLHLLLKTLGFCSIFLVILNYKNRNF